MLESCHCGFALTPTPENSVDHYDPFVELARMQASAVVYGSLLACYAQINGSYHDHFQTMTSKISFMMLLPVCSSTHPAKDWRITCLP